MSETPLQTEQLQGWLERMRSGDQTARDELLQHVNGQMERLTRKMLRKFPGVQRWEQTGDVLQNALLRLLRALQDVQPASTRAFFALASVQLRRELLDLARHYYGPHGLGANHASQVKRDGSNGFDKSAEAHDQDDLAQWCEFHQQVEQLPEEEREVVGLLFYQGLSQTAAAEVLGVTVRTVQRRWQSALLQLHRVLKIQEP